MKPLSEQLEGLCAFEGSVERIAGSLESRLRRFGELKRNHHADFDEAIRWLLPLTSFSSRYLVAPLSEWTVVLSNDLGAATDLLTSLTMSVPCRGVHGSWAMNGRMWHVVENGRTTCAVNCYEDGGRWVFHEEGTPLPFERPLPTTRRKRDRFTPEIVQRYLGELLCTEIPPNWRAMLDQGSVGLERSTHQVQVPIETYDVEIDL